MKSTYSFGPYFYFCIRNAQARALNETPRTLNLKIKSFLRTGSTQIMYQPTDLSETKRTKIAPSFPLPHERPIKSGEPDLLRRGRFVRSFARSLASAPRDESIVFGLYGEWGHGKSSILSLLKDEFDSPNFEYPHLVPIVIPFSPWVFSSREKLFSAFFEDIGNSLREHKGASDSDKAKARSEAWKTFGVTASVIGRTAGDIATIASIFDLSGTSLILSKLIKSATTNVEKSTKSAAEAAAKEATLSLEKSKDELSKIMKESEQPLLIILDDVDRLLPAELCELFQIVKALADIPNVHYLILAEEKKLTEHLSKIHPDPRYLEKIIQFTVKIPEASPSLITRYFCDGFKKIAHQFAPRYPDRFNDDFIRNLEENTLKGLFNNLREAKRCLGNIQLTFPIYCDETGHFKLHPVDFVVLHVIRVIDPIAYEIIRTNRNLISGSQHHSVSARGKLKLDKKKYQQDLETILATVPERTRDLYKTIVETNCNPTDITQKNNCRIQSEFAPSYFNTEETDLPPLGYKFTINIKNNLNSPDALKETLTQALEEHGISPIIENFMSEFDTQTWPKFLTTHQSLVTGLLVSLQTLGLSGRNETDIFGTSIAQYSDFILQHPEPEQTRRLFTNSVTESRNIRVASDLIKRFQLIGDKRPDIRANCYEPLVTAIADVTMPLIQEQASSNQLAIHSDFRDTQDVWLEFGDHENLKIWLENQCSNAEGLKEYLLSISNGFSDPSSSNDYQKRAFLLHYNDLIPFKDPSVMAKRCDELSTKAEKDDDKLIYETAAERFRKAAEFHVGRAYFLENHPEYLQTKSIEHSEALQYGHSIHVIRHTSTAVSIEDLVREFKISIGNAELKGGEYGDGHKALMITDSSEKTMQAIAEKLNEPAFYRLPAKTIREEVMLISTDLKARQYMGRTNHFFQPRKNTKKS